MDEKKLDRNETYTLIIDEIINLLDEGKIEKDKKLFSENQLSKKLGVSRAHVRDVYSALSILGIVESRQGEGTFFKSSQDEMTYKMLFIMMHMGNNTIEDIMEVRRIIEIGVAEKAATNRTAKDVTDMISCLGKMENCKDSVEMSRLDGELHSAIAKSTGNSLLTGLTRAVSGYTIRAINEHWKYIVNDKDSAVKRRTFEQHDELVSAIIRKKPFIAKAIAEDHLTFVESSINRYIEKFKKNTK